MAEFAVATQLTPQPGPTPAVPSRLAAGAKNSLGEDGDVRSPFNEVLAGCVTANCDGGDDGDKSPHDDLSPGARHIPIGTEAGAEVAPAAHHRDTASDLATTADSGALPPAVLRLAAPQTEPSLPVSAAIITGQGNSETDAAGEDGVNPAPDPDLAAMAATAGQVVAGVYLTMAAEPVTLTCTAVETERVSGGREPEQAFLFALHPTASIPSSGPRPAFNNQVREGAGQNAGAATIQADQVPFLSDGVANCTETGACNELPDGVEPDTPLILRDEGSARALGLPYAAAPGGRGSPPFSAAEARGSDGSITREGPTPPQVICGELPSPTQRGIAQAPGPASIGDGARGTVVGRRPPRDGSRQGHSAVVESGEVYLQIPAKSSTASPAGTGAQEGAAPLDVNGSARFFMSAPQATTPPNQYLSPPRSLEARSKNAPTLTGQSSKEDGEAEAVPVQAATVPAPNPDAKPILTLPLTSTPRPGETLRQASASPRKSSADVVTQLLAIGGEAPRTLDSVAPIAAVPGVETSLSPASKQPLAEALPLSSDVAPVTPEPGPNPSLGVQARALGVDTPDRDEVAFAVQVREIAASQEAAQRVLPVSRPAAEGAVRASQLPDDGTPAQASPKQAKRSNVDESDGSPARSERGRNPEIRPAEPTEGPQAGAAPRTTVHAAPDLLPKAQPEPGRTDSATPQTVQATEATESEIKPETARQAVPVRDLKFEVTGGEHRVEVRLSERGGEVKMTVRTPDAPLASTLRENLPALSARLSESGFKSDIWHPGTSGTGEWQSTGPSSGATQDANQDANAQDRQQDREPQHGSRQRHSQTSQETTPHKQKGKDFAWLISSLR